MAYTRDVTTMLVRKMADQRAASANVNGTLDATTLLVQELETARANQANAQKDLNSSLLVDLKDEYYP